MLWRPFARARVTAPPKSNLKNGVTSELATTQPEPREMHIVAARHAHGVTNLQGPDKRTLLLEQHSLNLSIALCSLAM